MKKPLREILAPMSTSEKIKYISHYYKFHILGTLAVLIFIALTINGIMNKKAVVLNMTIVGDMITAEKIEQLEKDIMDRVLTVEEQQSAIVNVHSIYFSREKANEDPQMFASIHKLAAELATASIDLLIIDTEFFNDLNEDDQLLSIETLSGKTFESTEPIYYASDSNRKVVGVQANSIDFFNRVLLKEDQILCVPANTKNEEYIKKFLQTIF